MFVLNGHRCLKVLVVRERLSELYSDKVARDKGAGPCSQQGHEQTCCFVDMATYVEPAEVTRGRSAARPIKMASCKETQSETLKHI